jgi:hypothetical protein
VEDARLEADAIEAGVGKRELVDLVQDIAAELDDRELSGLVRRRGCRGRVRLHSSCRSTTRKGVGVGPS